MSTAPAVLKSRAELEQAQERKQHWARVNAALDEIYSLRFNGKVLKPTQATAKAIIDLCARYSGVSPDPCVPSVQTIQEIYKTNYFVFLDTFGSLLAPVEDVRQGLIVDILIAHRCARPSITQFELDQERGKLNNGYTLQALRNRLRYILEAQRLMGKSVAQIQKAIEETRKANEPLPEQLPADLSPKKLREKLQTMTRRETDYFVSKWGWERINARLQGRDGFVEVQNTQA